MFGRRKEYGCRQVSDAAVVGRPNAVTTNQFIPYQATASDKARRQVGRRTWRPFLFALLSSSRTMRLVEACPIAMVSLTIL